MRVHNNKKFLERRKDLRESLTPEEEILWDEIRNNKLGARFRRQHSIGGYILDFYCFKGRLIIELDGSLHDKEYDVVRDTFFKQLGYQTMRFKNGRITEDLKNVLEEIKQTLSLRLGEGRDASPG